MANKKPPHNPDAITLNTPEGTLKWPKLTEPDYGTTQYPDKNGSFNTRVVFDKSDPAVVKFLAKVDAVLERSRELAEEEFEKLAVKDRKRLGGVTADDPYSLVYDEETEEETGEVEMRVKRQYSGVRKRGPQAGKKWFAKIGLFDSARPPKPIKKGVEIWGGTTAILNIELIPYFVAGTGRYGVSRRLNAVQIVDLVSSGGERSASSYGFEGSDDGFDSSDIEVNDDSGNDDAGDFGSDDDEGDDEADF